MKPMKNKQFFQGFILNTVTNDPVSLWDIHDKQL